MKHDEGKPDLCLIPPDLLLDVAHVMTQGAKKHGATNHKRPGVGDRFLSAAFRHIVAHRMGQKVDPEYERAHLVHAIADLFLHMDAHR